VPRLSIAVCHMLNIAAPRTSDSTAIDAVVIEFHSGVLQNHLHRCEASGISDMLHNVLRARACSYHCARSA
jgi:hypothetical protein